MKTVGQILREARENKGLSVAQAVEGTRSKSQVILQLEQDDFSRFPAPIYTRGFIKLYAEFLGLDASELISLYQARNAEADKIHRPASVLRPGSVHLPPVAPAAEIPPELDLQSPAPLSEPAEKTARPEPATPLPPPKPSGVELELSFDPPAAPSEAAPPPVVKPAVEAPVIPRRKAIPPKPAPKNGGPDEFSLEVREGAVSATARERAASIFALARASAGRLPWAKVMTRAGVVIGVLLVAGLLLSVIRGCVSRHRASAVPAETSSAPYTLPPAPEPPPLYLPDTPPRR